MAGFWELWSKFFSNASDTVLAASIAAFVTVLTFTIGRYFEQNRENKVKANVEKIRVYEMFFDFYFTVFGNSELIEKNDNPDWMALQIYNFQKELVLWGSDNVLRAYFQFRRDLVNHSLNEEKTTSVDALSITITSAAGLLKAMRQDIGYTFTTFSPRNLAIIQLKGDDPEFDELYDRLKG